MQNMHKIHPSTHRAAFVSSVWLTKFTYSQESSRPKLPNNLVTTSEPYSSSFNPNSLGFVGPSAADLSPFWSCCFSLLFTSAFTFFFASHLRPAPNGTPFPVVVRSNTLKRPLLFWPSTPTLKSGSLKKSFIIDLNSMFWLFIEISRTHDVMSHYFDPV